jgi:hypothetical protein
VQQSVSKTTLVVRSQTDSPTPKNDEAQKTNASRLHHGLHREAGDLGGALKRKGNEAKK